MSDAEQRVIVPLIQRLASWRQADRAHPRIRRWGVTVFIAAMGLPSLLNPRNEADAWAALALCFAFSLPLLWRERRPMLVFALTTAVSVVTLPLGVLSGSDAARAVALFNVGRICPPRQLVIALAVTVAQLVAWATVFTLGGQLQHATRPEVVTTLAIGGMAAVAGLGLAGRLVNVVIAALQRERDQQTRLAAAQERARVSREMHDILGHTLAIIVGLADGAAALAPTQPQRGADTLRIIADSGRGALGELRRLLAVIGDDDSPRDDAPLAPQPGLADLDALLGRFRAAGPTATLHTEGDLAGLAEGLQLAVYRIVQEALTNTLKYAAPDTTVTVSVTTADDRVRVAVEDTGPHRVPQGSHSGDSGGKGLVGMRQRAALYEGTVTAGPNALGGWSVHAVMLTTSLSAKPPLSLDQRESHSPMERHPE
ncbi:two-component sensor histidine kinase [Streptomyces spongiae]|uniref:histidine kinase n=2 Tax=Streptomyces spongiae TaxID=565072 RepID=A0A5N8XMD0_9ACTN|nr:two-component sensor histidine kinase [Streptomyces spongiae]